MKKYDRSVMSVDREARDRLADALAAFMRGDIDRRQYRAIADHPPKGDYTVAYYAFMTTGDSDKISGPVCVTEDGWNALVRCIAFLRSDLQLERPHRFSLLLTLFLCYVAVIVAIVRAEWDHAARLAEFWCVLSIGWFFAARVIQLFKQHRPEGKRNLFDPFVDEAEWLRFKPLSDASNIPEFDAQKHGIAESRLLRWLIRPCLAVATAIWLPLIAPALLTLQAPQRADA